MTTVHYQGTLPDPARRESLVLHLSACAKSMGWGAHDVALSEEGGMDNLIDCITRAAEMTHRQTQSARPFRL